MPTNQMLSLTPSYELVTRYGSAWQTPILSAASAVGLPTTDLSGSSATAANFFSAIEEQDPILVNLMGHGDYNLILCQNNELLLQGGVNDEFLAGRVVYVLSCRTGRDLGASAYARGAVSYLGYTEDFWIGFTYGDHPDGAMTDPLQDEVARGFFEPHNAAPISYINGSTIVGSYYHSQNAFNSWIRVWEEIDPQVAALLVWNRDYQILHSSEGVEAGGAGILPLLLAFAPLLLIPVLKKK